MCLNALFLLQKYRYLDSVDPERTAGVWGYVDIKPPERGDSRWPRMQIENRCYQSDVFRKLHIELAHRQDGLQVCAHSILQLLKLSCEPVDQQHCSLIGIVSCRTNAALRNTPHLALMHQHNASIPALWLSLLPTKSLSASKVLSNQGSLIKF